MLKYNFKRAEELFWAGLVGLSIFLLELLLRFDPDTVVDWRSYATAAGAGALRAFVGATLAALRKGGS